MSKGAPIRKCPSCGIRVHVRKKVCTCSHIFPAYNTEPEKTSKHVDSQPKVVLYTHVDKRPTETPKKVETDEVAQGYYRRVRTLEGRISELESALARTHKLMREMLKVCRAFNDVPTSLALFKQDGEWMGMNDKKEVRPVDLAEPEISFAQSDTERVMAAPWDHEDVFA
jgi:hypothetical protein